MLNATTKMQFPWPKRGSRPVEYSALNPETASSSDDQDSYHDEKSFGDDKSFFARPAQKHSERVWKIVVIVLLILTNLATFWTSYNASKRAHVVTHMPESLGEHKSPVTDRQLIRSS